MLNANKKITIILPLWDREVYTSVWIEKNIYDDFDYIIADGSKKNANQLIFEKLKDKANITYIRYPPDLSVRDFIDKMSDAANKVLTPFVMTCDNDDFINYSGVVNCVNQLTRDEGASCAGGPLYSVMKSQMSAQAERYTLPERGMDLRDIDGMSGFVALKYIFKNYKYTWYSVFRTAIYDKIWSDIRQLEICDIFLVEILHAQLSFVYGKYVYVKQNHYIRLQNPESSCARAGSVQMPHTYKIYFDNEYREQVILMSAYIAKLLGVELTDFLDEFKNYYIYACANKQLKLSSKIYRSLAHLYVSIPRRLHIYYPIEFGISFVNTLAAVK